MKEMRQKVSANLDKFGLCISKAFNLSCEDDIGSVLQKSVDLLRELTKVQADPEVNCFPKCEFTSKLFRSSA